VQQEEERAVVDARQAGTEAAAETLLLVLPLDEVVLRLPLDAERRVGQQVVEALSGEVVVREAVAEADVVDVVGP
jgi:hypothetical protein